jgi:hypothetical protein
MRDYTPCRVASTILGLICGGLGSYGAFEFAHKLECTMSYLVTAAPVVAVTAALSHLSPRRLGERVGT